MSKAGVRPSNINVKAIAEYAPLQTYTEIRAFLGLVGHYRCFIKGFTQIAQPLNEHLAGEGASRKSERVSLSEGALKAFEMLKQACMNSLVLAFALIIPRISCWKQMPRRKVWEQFSLRNRKMDGFTQWPTAAGQVLTLHEKNYHSTKLEFLALKWAIMEHFKEYLLYQPFLVKTNNNPLTYIMSTPNLDAIGHHWVNALAKYDFHLEYQKGQDNAVADALSWVTTRLQPEAVQAILDGAAMGTSQHAERESPAIIENNQ